MKLQKIRCGRGIGHAFEWMIGFRGGCPLKYGWRASTAELAVGSVVDIRHRIEMPPALKCTAQNNIDEMLK